MTNQPSFWCVANIGDADPYEHGGAFVLVDRRGIYCPELIVMTDSDDSSECRLAYSIRLERLTAVKQAMSVVDDQSSSALGWIGVSDNRFHPNLCAWFGNCASLSSVARFIGSSFDKLIVDLLSSDPVTLASAYKSLADYHGPLNFDSDPQTLSGEKAKLMCDRFLAQIEESRTWHDGYYP